MSFKRNSLLDVEGIVFIDVERRRLSGISECVCECVCVNIYTQTHIPLVAEDFYCYVSILIHALKSIS